MTFTINLGFELVENKLPIDVFYASGGSVASKNCITEHQVGK